jgi:hypothetical protein
MALLPFYLFRGLSFEAAPFLAGLAILPGMLASWLVMDGVLALALARLVGSGVRGGPRTMLRPGSASAPSSHNDSAILAVTPHGRLV